LKSDDAELQDLLVLLYRIALAKQESFNLFDAILPGYSRFFEREISVPKPGRKTTEKADILNQKIQDVDHLLHLKETACVNAKGASFADAFIVLPLKQLPSSQVATDTTTEEKQGGAPYEFVAILVQSKRKETPEERGRTDVELWNEYKKAVWNHREAFITNRIFPVFVYITDSTAHDASDPGTRLHITLVLSRHLIYFWYYHSFKGEEKRCKGKCKKETAG
jgi:hypothetical protein